MLDCVGDAFPHFARLIEMVMVAIGHVSSDRLKRQALIC
jgi:hypothetical protein